MHCRLRFPSLLIVVWATAVFSGCDTIKSMTGAVEEVEEAEQQVVQQPSQKPPAPTEKRVAPRRDVPREMLIEPPQGEWPEPLPELIWLTSLEAGLQAVGHENRPLLVLIHCPVADRSGNLNEILLAPPPPLSDLLRQFVTVELTDGRQIDLNRMPFAGWQDPDQTWWCWILSPQGQVYSVLGRESPASPEVTVTDFTEWAHAVLDHHWDPRRPDWNADGEPVPPSVAGRSVTNSVGYDRWRDGAEYLGHLRDGGKCLCCHQVQDILWVEQDETLENGFDRHFSYWIWPPTENLGFEFDAESSIEVSSVNSSKAVFRDLQVGDLMGIVDGDKRVFSATDIRAAIHRLQGDRRFFNVHVARDDKATVLGWRITPGFRWRNYQLDWRNSIGESVLATHPGFLVAEVQPDIRQQIGLADRMALVPIVGQGSPAWSAGIRPNQVIVGLKDIEEDLTPEEFLFAYSLTSNPGTPTRIIVRTGRKLNNVRSLFIEAISVLDIPQDDLQMLRDNADIDDR